MKVRNSIWELGERDLIWQHLPAAVHAAGMIVLMQESRILSNYPLLLGGSLRQHRIAYWGHGRNFQTTAPSGIRERWKSWLINKVDWWFAYTEATSSILRAAGYPSSRITCVNNTIDTIGFRGELDSITPEELAQTRRSLGIGDNAPVGIFCGSLYPDKRVEFLVDAGDYIRKEIPDFTLLIIGDGPSMSALQTTAKVRPWLHLLGSRRGIEKARLFRLADVMLNPGLVGLHVLDAFCAGLPIFTLSSSRHSPEIVYLGESGSGFVTSESVEEYGRSVVHVLTSPKDLSILRQRSLTAAESYTLENMVARFVSGILGCLSAPRFARRWIG
jgi:glycosyltransferase involved in cell wall biosynthesis